MLSGGMLETPGPSGSPAEARFVSFLRTFRADASGRAARLAMLVGALVGLGVFGLVAVVMGEEEFGPVVGLVVAPVWVAAVGGACFFLLTDRVVRVGRGGGVVERQFFWRTGGGTAAGRPLLSRRIDPARWRYVVPVRMRLSGAGVSREFFQVYAAKRLGRGWRRGAMLVFAEDWGWGTGAENGQLALLDRIGEATGWEVRVDPRGR